MRHWLKSFIRGVLTPLAWLSDNAGQPLRRAWIHASFDQQLQHPLPSSAVVLGRPEVHGTGAIRCGHNLFLYRDLYLETREEGEIELGEEVVVSRGAHIVAYSKVTIGSGTMIGEYSGIRDANHNYREAGRLRGGGHVASPIRIGDNVWLGRGVTVLPGVRIGDGAVVGANAVVTGDVARGAVVAGVPARPLPGRGDLQ